MVRIVTTVSLRPDCAEWIEELQTTKGTSFSQWVQWCIKNRKNMGIDRAFEAEMQSFYWYWVVQRMHHHSEPMLIAMKMVSACRENGWEMKQAGKTRECFDHMLMDAPPSILENQEGGEEE